MVTKSVYSGLTSEVVVKKARYWTEHKYIAPTSDTTINIELKPYDYLVEPTFVTPSNNQGLLITIPSFELWNNEIFVGGTRLTANNAFGGEDGYTVPDGDSTKQYAGCLAAGLFDVDEEQEYYLFVKPTGEFLLSLTDDDIEGYFWANKVTVPAHNRYPEISFG